MNIKIGKWRLETWDIIKIQYLEWDLRSIVYSTVREHIHAESVIKAESAVMVQSAEIPPSPTYTKPSPLPWPDFEHEVNELQDWLILLQHVRKAQIVTVGDIVEIEETIIKQKVKNKKAFFGRLAILQLQCIRK